MRSPTLDKMLMTTVSHLPLAAAGCLNEPKTLWPTPGSEVIVNDLRGSMRHGKPFAAIRAALRPRIP